ncbi:MAG TPA: hypothetical protein EYG03_05560 [Planctomycetes bacterium]|nr:hypothetical protein [Fuerstiella sp.]HIK91439.1 hypothetical protein [Planctomycetota bacterium]
MTKRLTYANGVEPGEMDRIPAKSAEHDYRIADTIAAAIDSSLLREE